MSTSGTQDGSTETSASILATCKPSTRDSSSQPSVPFNRLAAVHADCPCYADPRCQLAVAFQEAREYWKRHPDDKENAPNEIHESIEQWLVENRLLEGPPRTIYEEPEEISVPDKNPTRGAARRFPRIRSLNLRRLSLPTGLGESAAFALPLLSPTRVQRRHTDGGISESKHKKGQEGPYSLINPASPRNLLRVFRSAKRKRTMDAQTARSNKPTCDDASHNSCTSSGPPSVPETASAEQELVSEPSVPCDDICEDALSIYEDALDVLFQSGASTSERCTSDAALSPAVSLRDFHTPNSNIQQLATEAPPAIADTHAEVAADADADPASNALMSILYELDAFAEHPRHAAIAASHNDPEYVRFWEAFAQLTAREILLAVYALRAGAFDEPHIMVVGDAGPAGTVVAITLVLWAMSASGLAVYLYCCSS
ncbi:hypothetical protein BC628DRAFT_850401 [Trametes gibbosa]|nr:hypothetical protein BC628DRAFT_850401 [Trametes gibbosa]